MPPRMLKRGRPKGAGLTVIGLPKKRKVTGAIPFIKKSPTEKERGKLKVLMYNYTVILMLKLKEVASLFVRKSFVYIFSIKIMDFIKPIWKTYSHIQPTR
jgi:hypothetical protein